MARSRSVSSRNPLENLEAFLATGGEFRLGHLPTEQVHPRTRALSAWARADPARAFRRFAEVDAAALRTAARAVEKIARLAAAIAATRAAGGRIFLVGCGATGRLVLNLEELWRRQAAPEERDGVVAFMAGGDAALVRSFEGFEDHPEYGARHLRQLGFRKRDLLIAVTEGGETPYVIGAALEAAKRGERAPWFVFCNPAPLLARTLARCREVLRHPRVRPLELTVGPMAVTGSTRLQATTVQMAAVGWALLHGGNAAGCTRFFETLARAVRDFPHAAQTRLMRAEEQAYRRGGRVEYRAAHRAITVLADTTERAPTFNLAPFENRGERAPRLSWCYVTVAGARDAAAAWRQLLGDRRPRPLDWQQPARFRRQLTLSWMHGFDLSERGRARRSCATELRVELRRDGRVQLEIGRAAVALPRADDPLAETLLLKLALNAHSTVLMGRMERYAGNVMTWVKPTNLKLVDRATRYVQALTGTRYRDAAAAVFAVMPELTADRSVVEAAVEWLGGKERSARR